MLCCAVGVLERLVSCVEQQQSHLASCGVLDSEGRHEEDSTPPCRELLQQLGRRAQLWPALEQLAVLNQLRVTADLLQLSVSPGYIPTVFACTFSMLQYAWY